MVFNNFSKIFCDNIYAGKCSINDTEMDQTNLLENMIEFNNNYRPKPKEGRELNLNAFRSGIFSRKEKMKNTKNNNF